VGSGCLWTLCNSGLGQGEIWDESGTYSGTNSINKEPGAQRGKQRPQQVVLLCHSLQSPGGSAGHRQGDNSKPPKPSKKDLEDGLWGG